MMGSISVLENGMTMAKSMLRATRVSGRWALWALSLFLVTLPVHAVLVDNFDTDQGPIAPGDMPDSVGEGSPGDMVGGNRDIDTNRTAGVGEILTEVTGGDLIFAINNMVAGTQGEGLISWDGNALAEVDGAQLDATGLGGLDFTAMGHNAFRLTVDQATAGTEIRLEVFTDGANSSMAFLRLPAVAATQDFVLSYGKDFVPIQGAGADFTNVGAIQLRISGEVITAVIENLETVAPSIEVTMQDRDPMTDMPIAGSVVPGQRMKYRVEITNTGGEALEVDLSDMVDANTTLDMASVDAFAIAANDSYRTVGNGFLASGAMNTVLANDADPDSGTPPMPGDSVKCPHIAMEAEKCKVVVASSDTASGAGGTVNWLDTDPSPADGMTDGQFEYTPPAGFVGVDSFSYTMVDDEGNTASADVSVLVGPTVWFVDDDAAGSANLGTLNDPFNSVASLNTNLNGAEGAMDLDGPGDIIFLFNGTDNTIALTQPFELEENQQLIGEGSGLTLFGTEIVAADPTNDPVLSSASTHGIALGEDNEIRGLTIANTPGFAISGLDFLTLTVDNVVINGNGGALSLGMGSLAGSFESISSAGASGRGIELDNVSGDLLVNGSTTITDPEGTAIRVVNGGSTYDFGATTITGAGNTAGHGIEISNNPTSTFTFDSLAVSTDNGIGLLANNGGTVNINSTATGIAATGGASVDITNTTGQTNGSGAVGWTFATLASTNSLGQGVRLNNLPNNFNVGTSTMVTDSAATSILVQNSAGRSIDLGATTVNDTNTGAAPAADGIDLTTGNGGAAFFFDSLAVTAQGDGLLANNSGTINVGGTGSTINAVGGRAVDANMTAFDDGASGGGATFSSVSSSNSPTTGINLVGVGGFFTANGGSITGAAGTAFNVGAAANMSGGAGNITYAGSITNTAGRSVSIQERNGGTVTLSGNINDTGTGLQAINNNNGTANTIALSGGSKVFNTGTNTAIDLNENDDATINFSGGGLDVDTTTVTAFDVTGGAAGLNVTGIGNTVATTTGTAVNIADSTLGASGVEFASINSTTAGSNVTIILDDTGAGTFTVTGMATTDGTGGTISNKDADGVTLNNTDGLVNLRNMIFQDIGDMSGGFDQSSGHDAIHGQVVDGGLRLDNVHFQRISDQAVNGTLLADGVSGTSWNGLEIRDSLIEDTNRWHVANVADSQADEGMVRIVGLTGAVVVDNSVLQRGVELLDFTTLGTGTLNMTVTRNNFNTAFKEFTSGVIPAVGRICVDVTVEGTSTANITIGDQADMALGNMFLNCGVASVRVNKGIAAAGAANIDFILARNSFRGNDKSSTLGTAGNFPQGGVALRAGPGGINTFDAIVSRNTFGVFVPPDDRMGSTTDEIMNADGVEGNLVMIFEDGAAQARVDNNEFNGSINAPWSTRADNNTSAAVLFQNNLYRGRDDFFSPDPGFGTFTVPGVPYRTRVLGGGNLDLTFRNENFVQHDQFFFFATEVAEFEVLNVGPGGSGSPPFGGNLCLHFDSVVSPDGFEFEEQAGTIELFQGANNAAATGPCTAGSTGDCEAEMADDGNRGGPSTRNQLTGVPTPTLNPPFVDVDAGSISITGTQCTEPSGGIF